jgi:hypothetical protein
MPAAAKTASNTALNFASRPGSGTAIGSPAVRDPASRPAGRMLRRLHRGRDLPEVWLIAEWLHGAAEPVKYWLSNLPAGIAKRMLVRAAKLRWRIEHDYREIKTGLGLDHYEGRTWQDWHHHVTLVCAAHAFLTLQRLDPKPLRRNDPLRCTPTPAAPARLPDRHLPTCRTRLPQRDADIVEDHDKALLDVLLSGPAGHRDRSPVLHPGAADGHYELGVDARPALWAAAALTELAEAI